MRRSSLLAPLRVVPFVASALVVACTPITSYRTKTTLHVNQVSSLWQAATYRYVAIGVTGTARAPAGSRASKALGRSAMDALVKAANLQPNQALVDVTIEQGDVYYDGTVTRVVTLRGDVVEFLSETAATAAGEAR